VWAVVMAGGGLLAGGYLYRVLALALSGESSALKRAPARSRQSVALVLALVALLLAFAPPSFFAFLQIGRPAAALALQ
jgi:multicomponent Na+:H+ antiporter subunit D